MAINRIKYVNVGSQMEESDFIKHSSSGCILQSLNVTENGTYLPPEGVDGFDKVMVNVSKNKYGISPGIWIGNAVNGVLGAPGETSVVFNGFEDVAEMGLGNTFYYNQNIRNVAFSDDIKRISGSQALAFFAADSSILSLVFSGVEEISGFRAFQKICSSSALQGLFLPKLGSVTGEGALYKACDSCEYLREVDISSLHTISGSAAFFWAFRGCLRLTNLSFPKLVNVSNDALNGMLMDCSQEITIHFRSDARSTIESLEGYSEKFGATNGVILFDLPNI